MTTPDQPPRTELLKATRWSLVAFIVVCLVPGEGIAWLGIVIFGHDWDKGLIKPSVTQFNWVFFVVVWLVNYTTMGVAAWLVWLRRPEQPQSVGRALRWFWFQLGLSFLWIPVVHGTGSVMAAVVMDVVVGISAFVAGYQFYKIRRAAFYWYVPYLVWTLITTHAKVWMYWLNRP